MYAFLIKILSPLFVLVLAIEAYQRKGGWPFFKQRLGFGYPTLTTHPIWIHCASVGEVKAAEPLIEHFAQSQALLITTNTPTGADLVKRLFGDSVQHVYLPFDFSSAVGRFLKATQPQVLWVMETELWPNLYRLTAQHHIAITLINARLSAKTLKAPKWLQHAYRETLQFPQQILARCESEAQRFMALGARPEQLQILGNLKYGLLSEQTQDYPNLSTREYVLLASSHDTEELMIAQRWLNLQRPECLVIVPRHPKRSESIQQQLATLKVSVAVHSLKQPLTSETQIYLDDRIGVLMPWFSHAKLVIMGGAFVPKGGHNVLEPAALGKCIITGPDMSDFVPETELLLQANALVQCQDYEELSQTLHSLLAQPERCEQMGQAAKQVILSQSHIFEDYLKTLQKQVRNASTS